MAKVASYNKKNIFLFLAAFLVSTINIKNIQALTLINRYVDQNLFDVGPCGCIALMCAGEISGNEKQALQVLKKAADDKLNLTSSDVIEKLAAQLRLNLHCLSLKNNSPVPLGKITYF